MSKVKLYSVPEANELIYAACIRTLNKAKAKRARDIKQLRKELKAHDFVLCQVTNQEFIESLFAKYLED